MKLHDDDISAGDYVYDVAMGRGRVLSVDPVADFGIVVKFGPRTQGYNSDGKTPRFSQATLYWSDPVLVRPSKYESHRRLIRAAVRGMYEEMRRIVE